MTIQRSDGPMVSVGVNPAIGSTTPTFTGPAPYVSGSNENPDAGPNSFYAGNMLRDFRIRSRPDGVDLVAGGYANQDFGYLENLSFTLDFAPAAIVVNNIVTTTGTTALTPLTLTAGTGTSILATAFTVPGTLNVIPAGALQIDAAPTYKGYGTSGALQAWNLAAADRAITVTGGASVITVHGYDIYGVPVTQQIASGTHTSLKGFKWIGSIVPTTTSATTLTVGTADVFGFPLRADLWCDVLVWVSNTLITASTGFVAAVTTNPATATTGATRGTYALQTPSDGTIRLQVKQTVRPANSDTVAGMWGVTQF